MLVNELKIEGFVCKRFLPSFPIPAPLFYLRILVPFFARSLTLLPRSLLLNRTETLATQAKPYRQLKQIVTGKALLALGQNSGMHYQTN